MKFCGFVCCFRFCFEPHHVACGSSVSWPGIEAQALSSECGGAVVEGIPWSCIFWKMFSGVLEAPNIKYYCLGYMFQGWTSTSQMTLRNSTNRHFGTVLPRHVHSLQGWPVSYYDMAPVTWETKNGSLRIPQTFFTSWLWPETLREDYSNIIPEHLFLYSKIPNRD